MNLVIIQLIDSASRDKIISVEEKQVIIQKAIELGEDVNSVIALIEHKNSAKEVTKCVACGDLILALDRVCPSCNYVQNTSGEVNYKLDDLIHEIETLVAKIKSFQDNKLTSRILYHLNLSIPILCCLSFVIGWNFNSDVLAGTFFISLLFWIFIVKKIRPTQILNSNETFQALQSEFEKKYRIIDLYYGKDSRTKSHIEILNNEISAIKANRTKIILYEIAIYAATIGGLILIGFISRIQQ
jgi:hypothetical protein